MNETVLLVEDDDGLRRSIALVLRASGMHVIEAADGETAVDAFQAETPAIVVLDIMLPGRDGFSVYEAIREQSDAPIIMVTARDAAADIVRGLELGADDYVVKPFEAAVLLARVRAVLRRSSNTGASVLEAGGIRVDTSAWKAWRRGEALSLTAMDLRLLADLVRHKGQVMTREVLLERVWGYDYLGDSRLVDMAVKRLRDKIEDDSSRPSLITTVRGVGYRFEA
jgi:two-component system response regulator MtrA